MNGLFESYRLSELRSLSFKILIKSAVCLLFISRHRLRFAFSPFLCGITKRQKGLRQGISGKIIAEYPIWHKSWKAAAIILPEIVVAVLGMAAGLCTFAKEKDVKKAKRTP